jgi:hypothetical protein
MHLLLFCQTIIVIQCNLQNIQDQNIPVQTLTVPFAFTDVKRGLIRMTRKMEDTIPCLNAKG